MYNESGGCNSFFIAKNLCITPLLKNVWTKDYNQSPNSTLGGLHITQTIHDFVEEANLTRNPSKWSCNGRQQWVRKFMPEVPFGCFFLVVILGIVHKVNHLTRYR
jgi:hypothetical protein